MYVLRPPSCGDVVATAAAASADWLPLLLALAMSTASADWLPPLPVDPAASAHWRPLLSSGPGAAAGAAVDAASGTATGAASGTANGAAGGGGAASTNWLPLLELGPVDLGCQLRGCCCGPVGCDLAFFAGAPLSSNVGGGIACHCADDGAVSVAASLSQPPSQML